MVMPSTLQVHDTMLPSPFVQHVQADLPNLPFPVSDCVSQSLVVNENGYKMFIPFVFVLFFIRIISLLYPTSIIL